MQQGLRLFPAVIPVGRDQTGRHHAADGAAHRAPTPPRWVTGNNGLDPRHHQSPMSAVHQSQESATVALIDGRFAPSLRRLICCTRRTRCSTVIKRCRCYRRRRYAIAILASVTASMLALRIGARNG